MVNCGCDTEERGGDWETGEEDKEAGHKGPIGTVKVLLPLLGINGSQREGVNTVFLIYHSFDTSSTWTSIMIFLECKGHPYFHLITLRSP